MLSQRPLADHSFVLSSQVPRAHALHVGSIFLLQEPRTVSYPSPLAPDSFKGFGRCKPRSPDSRRTMVRLQQSGPRAGSVEPLSPAGPFPTVFRSVEHLVAVAPALQHRLKLSQTEPVSTATHANRQEAGMLFNQLLFTQRLSSMAALDTLL